VPFLTSTFEKTCKRCAHFVQYKIEYASKTMLWFILLASLNSAFLVGINVFMIKFTKNIEILLLIDTLVSLMQGSIFWKINKKLLQH
jgi:hypothetical protein